jgi:hypothetical protein
MFRDRNGPPDLAPERSGTDALGIVYVCLEHAEAPTRRLPCRLASEPKNPWIWNLKSLIRKRADVAHIFAPETHLVHRTVATDAGESRPSYIHIQASEQPTLESREWKRRDPSRHIMKVNAGLAAGTNFCCPFPPPSAWSSYTSVVISERRNERHMYRYICNKKIGEWIERKFQLQFFSLKEKTSD